MMMSWFGVVVAFLLAITSWNYLALLWRRRKLAPGPIPLPIIGNLLQVGQRPHYYFTQLSQKYGPLVSVHLGSRYGLVVTSPEMAKEVLHKNSQIYSGRPDSQAAEACDHHILSMGCLPVTSNPCRELRMICKEQMFSHEGLEATRGLRRHNMRLLLEHLQKQCDGGRAVDVCETAFINTLNLISSTLFSTKVSDFESKSNTADLKKSVEEVIQIISLANLADLFPLLKRFDLQGVKRRTGVGRLLDRVGGYVRERVKLRDQSAAAAAPPRNEDLLDRVLNSAGEYPHVSADHVTHLMLDMLVAGTDTSASTIEWVMSTLLLHPDKLEKVKDELRRVLGDEKQIAEESDIEKLPYLEAVIKEVLRYTPPGPFLFPRKAEADHQLAGYDIPKGAWVFINAWGMARDPAVWDDPDAFVPERFLDKDIAYLGKHFHFIPFGAGRRICPGLSVATRVVMTTVAILLHNFDWEFEQGAAAAQADHHDKLIGLTMKRAVPLRIIPIQKTATS